MASLANDGNFGIGLMDKISIHALSVKATIGIHDWEREQKQPLAIDLDLFVDTTNAAKTDVIEDTVSYGDVARLITDLAESSRYYLIESLATAIADTIIEGFPIEHLSVTVSKPGAVSNAENVSVTIERGGQ